MRTILVVLFVALFLILDLPIMGIQWIISKFNKKHADIVQLRMVQWAFKGVSFLSGVKLEVIGEENVPKDEAVMYVGNHRGFFDVVITYARVPGLTGYVAKKSIDNVPILGMVMRRLYCLFIDREDIKQSLQIILQAIEQVKNGISVCIFPEGTRNKDKDHPTEMNEFKEGSFKIATKTGCKIIPMAIVGTDNCIENSFPWIKSTKVTLQYGAPIDPKSLSKEEQKRIGAYTQAIISDMLKDICS